MSKYVAPLLVVIFIVTGTMSVTLWLVKLKYIQESTVRPRNSVLEILEVKTGKGLSWKVIFAQPLHSSEECGKAENFLRESARLMNFDKNFLINFRSGEKDATVTLYPSSTGMAKSATTLNSLKLITESANAAHYEITFDSWLPIKETGTHIAQRLAVLDGALRGHREGEEDGISVSYTFVQNPDGSAGGTVNLLYFGGVYGAKK